MIISFILQQSNARYKTFRLSLFIGKLNIIYQVTFVIMSPRDHDRRNAMET